MMDAPKCPICRNRHYGLCAGLEHEAKADRARAPVQARPKDSKKKSRTVSVLGSGKLDDRIYVLEGVVEGLLKRVSELEDRKKYMRDYMRDRRKK